jgi:hypothetical protein
MRTITKYAGIAVALAAVATVGTVSLTAKSADHKDSPAAAADPAADINDVFTFVDGNNFVAAMTVFPFADTGASFSNATQYVFHTTSGTKFGESVKNADIVCTFASNTSIQCWAGSEYVTGDPSKPAGLASASGKLKVYAGLVGDPFFFNLTGFKDTVKAVEDAVAGGGVTIDPNVNGGCPAVDGATSTALLGLLKETTSASDPAKTAADDFKAAKVLALVVSVDKSIVNSGGPVVSVWASTNKK